MATARKLNSILLIDDQVTTVRWLTDLVESLGYRTEQRTTEAEGRVELERVSRGDAHFAAAIIDVMVPTHGFEEIIELDDDFLEESKDSGIRLCRFARRELGISEKVLPILCISARTDQVLLDQLQRLGIPFFNRTDSRLRDYLRQLLSDADLPGDSKEAADKVD